MGARPLLAAALTLGMCAGACFRPPSADVLFACDAAAAPQCPPGYTCADDGCCHRDGTDPEQNAGACRVLDSAGSGTATGTGSGSAGTATGTATGASTGTGSTSGSGTSGTSGATGSTGTGASDTGTSTSTSG